MKLLWRYHSHKTSLTELSHSAIQMLGFYKRNLDFWPKPKTTYQFKRCFNSNWSRIRVREQHHSHGTISQRSSPDLRATSLNVAQENIIIGIMFYDWLSISNILQLRWNKGRHFLCTLIGVQWLHASSHEVLSWTYVSTIKRAGFFLRGVPGLIITICNKITGPRHI